MKFANLIFLHGFLGKPQDWDQVLSHMQVGPDVKIYKLNILNEKFLGPQQSLKNWGTSFQGWLRENKIEGSCVLIGYSMGGRLALHAFLANPERFEKIILISTNPGYRKSVAPEIREQRVLDDKKWAVEFRKSEWETVLKQWNSQSIFIGRQEEPQRSQADYSREQLANILEYWSLGLQEDMREIIQRYAQKMYWIVGDLDEKYKSDAFELSKLAPDLKLSVVSGASHRILFDQPKALGQLLSRACDRF